MNCWVHVLHVLVLGLCQLVNGKKKGGQNKTREWIGTLGWVKQDFSTRNAEAATDDRRSSDVLRVEFYWKLIVCISRSRGLLYSHLILALFHSSKYNFNYFLLLASPPKWEKKARSHRLTQTQTQTQTQTHWCSHNKQSNINYESISNPNWT